MQEEEFYVITWEGKKEQIFEMPTGGAAIMRSGPNLLKLARKEQCLALLCAPPTLPCTSLISQLLCSRLTRRPAVLCLLLVISCALTCTNLQLSQQAIACYVEKCRFCQGKSLHGLSGS